MDRILALLGKVRELLGITDKVEMRDVDDRNPLCSGTYTLSSRDYDTGHVCRGTYRIELHKPRGRSDEFHVQFLFDRRDLN